jgi:hypothetical protein
MKIYMVFHNKIQNLIRAASLEVAPPLHHSKRRGILQDGFPVNSHPLKTKGEFMVAPPIVLISADLKYGRPTPTPLKTEGNFTGRLPSELPTFQNKMGIYGLRLFCLSKLRKNWLTS